MTPYICGMPPAALIAFPQARSASGWMPALQGLIEPWPLATPTMGFKIAIAEADGEAWRGWGTGDTRGDEFAAAVVGHVLLRTK